MKFIRIFWLAISLACCVLGEDDSSNPLLDIASSLLQEHLAGGGGDGEAGANLGAIGVQLVQSFLQQQQSAPGQGNIADLLLGGGGGRAGAGKQFDASSLLSGLGSLFAGAGHAGGAGADNNGGLDPQLVGQLVSMLATNTLRKHQQQVEQEEIETNTIDSDRKPYKAKQQEASGIDLESLANLASSFLPQNDQPGDNGGGLGMEHLLNLAPLLLGNALPAPPKAQSPPPTWLPPFLVPFWGYWDHFANSEMAKSIWETSGLGKILELFRSQAGKLDVEKIFRSLENTSFRKRWIKGLTGYIAKHVNDAAEPKTRARYLQTAQMVTNQFLQGQGFPKNVQFDPNRPGESLSLIINSAVRRYSSVEINSEMYIHPAVNYVKEWLSIAENKGWMSRIGEVENKVADTVNNELIEPALAVWSAYRFAKQRKSCDRYVLCAVNHPKLMTHKEKTDETPLRPGVTKLASFVAMAFLNAENGTPYWELYSAITENYDCQVQYPQDCSEFHIKKQNESLHTDSIHNEL